MLDFDRSQLLFDIFVLVIDRGQLGVGNSMHLIDKTLPDFDSLVLVTDTWKLEILASLLWLNLQTVLLLKLVSKNNLPLIDRTLPDFDRSQLVIETYQLDFGKVLPLIDSPLLYLEVNKLDFHKRRPEKDMIWLGIQVSQPD